MPNRGQPTPIAVLVFGITASLAAVAAAQDDAQEERDPQDLAVQVAEAQLTLAEMNLAQVEQLDVENTLANGVVQQFAQEKLLAERRLKIARDSAGPNSYAATIDRLQMSLRAANDRAERAYETYQRTPELMTAADVKRLRQIARVTSLQLDRGLALKNASPEEQIQWQLEVLGSELDRMRVYTYLLGQNRLGEFAPGL